MNSRNDSLLDLSSQLGLSSLLHLGQNHGGDLLGRELLLLTLVLNLDDGGTLSVNNGEGEVLRIRSQSVWSFHHGRVGNAHLHVLLDVGVVETTSDQSLGVENGVGGVLKVHFRLAG